ncbi:MAG: AAA family ATPase, partial [Cyanobacteria bacterium J06635_11]
MAIISSKQSAAGDGDKKGKQKKRAQSRTPKANSSDNSTLSAFPDLPTQSAVPVAEELPVKEDLLEAEAKPAELSRNEEGLRPTAISDYIGQKALKEVLMIAIQAAKSRQEPLDHLLLYGPPGLGKTTMALILAQEMEVDCKITTAPALERPRDIAGLLVN